MEDVPRLRVGLGLAQRSRGRFWRFFGIVLVLLGAEQNVGMVGWLRCFCIFLFGCNNHKRLFVLYTSLRWIHLDADTAYTVY